MKLLATIFLTLCPAALLAQVSLHNVDTISRITDSLDRLIPGKHLARGGPQQAIDSLKQKQTDVYDKVRSKAELRTKLYAESKNMDALKNQLDSLRVIRSPDTIVTKYLMNVKTRSDSLQKLLRLPPQTAEITKLQQRARDELNKLPSQVNEKLKLFADQGANVGQLSGIDLPGLQSAAVPVPALPSAGLPGIQTSGVSIPQLNGPGSPIPPNLNLNTEIPNAGEVTKPLGEVASAGKQLSAAGKDLKAVSSGNLDSLDSKVLESRLADAAGVSVPDDSFAEAAKQAELLKKWNSDPMYKRELTVTVAKEQAVNHFSGREAELLSAMEQLSQAKSKVKDAEQVIDLFSKPSNPMKEKPFIERLRPGVNLQIQWRQIVLVDINPYVGYRISGRWTAGIGWNERIGFSSDTYSFSEADRVRGVRSFAQFKIKEGNHLILAPELMNTYVPAHTVPTGESNRKWVPGLMAGYKREFRYSRKVVGTVQVLYNLVAPAGQSGAQSQSTGPYASRFNLLIGFEFPLKKKV